MVDNPADDVVEYKVKERLRRTDLEITGSLLPGTVTGRLTEEGLNKLFDSLSVGGFKFTTK